MAYQLISLGKYGPKNDMKQLENNGEAQSL